MAIVKSKDDVIVAGSGLTAFAAKYKPGQAVVHSGIYRCTGCGDEIASNKGTVFPPQNHHQHPPGTALVPAKPIEWQLLVFSQSK